LVELIWSADILKFCDSKISFSARLQSNRVFWATLDMQKKMRPFEKCPVCGGELENKHVEKLLRGSGNTMSMHFKI